MDQLVPMRVLAVIAACALAGAAWVWFAAAPRDLQQFASWMAPYRHTWYALPMVVMAFIILAPVPVLVLIAATGIAFGPVLGPIYAMAGCLSSASVGFAAGRWMGQRRVGTSPLQAVLSQGESPKEGRRRAQPEHSRAHIVGEAGQCQRR